MLAWSIRTLRTRFTIPKAWLALAAATAFTLLITYHRPWDAKLVMLAIPPCSMLWARHDWLGKIAFAATAPAVLFAGDLPLSAFKTSGDYLHPGTTTLGGQLLTVILMRPESLALLAMGVFYLWAYLRTAAIRTDRFAASNAQVQEAGAGR